MDLGNVIWLVGGWPEGGDGDFKMRPVHLVVCFSSATLCWEAAGWEEADNWISAGLWLSLVQGISRVGRRFEVECTGCDDCYGFQIEWGRNKGRAQGTRGQGAGGLSVANEITKTHGRSSIVPQSVGADDSEQNLKPLKNWEMTKANWCLQERGGEWQDLKAWASQRRDSRKDKRANVWKLDWRKTMSAYLPAQWREACGEKTVPTWEGCRASGSWGSSQTRDGGHVPRRGWGPRGFCSWLNMSSRGTVGGFQEEAEEPRALESGVWGEPMGLVWLSLESKVPV